jgi:bifunctional UDP-N-acetylglucosamine pyrophosphorylase / glucosamine-1-phosphate N-acetyltransferase
MWNTTVQAVVLAAGKAKRFRTGRTKLLEKICGREMILYPTKLLEGLDIKTTLVIGHQKDEIENIIKHHHGDQMQYAHQKKQLGTGHAISCAQDHWNKNDILILNGDMPLITPQIIESLYIEHHTKKAVISFVVSHLEHPGHAYGRVIQENKTIKIVEAKDFQGDPTAHCWINAGIYLINRKFLQDHIHQLEQSNASKEFYITDLVGMASDKKLVVATVPASFDRIRGINTLEELWTAEQIKRADLIRYWMSEGVRFMKAQNVHLDIDVTIGAGSCIGGGVYLLGNTQIGKNCTVHEYTRLENAQIGQNSIVRSHCVITNSILENNVDVGPFAHVRTDSVIKQNASVGNFVEIKKCTIGQNSLARHLAYLGDAQLGKNVNIGAGTITCNYDGFNKEKTVIDDNTFIGSNNTLVAPVSIGRNSFTGAGSTITDDVPEETVAFGRAQQVNKENYAPTLRKKLQKKFDDKEKELY